MEYNNTLQIDEEFMSRLEKFIKHLVSSTGKKRKIGFMERSNPKCADICDGEFLQNYYKKHTDFTIGYGKEAGTECFYYLVFYDEKRPLIQQLFVLAHELGHVLLGHVDNEAAAYQRDNSNDEWEADFFAAMFMFLAQGALPIMETMRNSITVRAEEA